MPRKRAEGPAGDGISPRTRAVTGGPALVTGAVCPVDGRGRLRRVIGKRGARPSERQGRTGGF